MDYLKVGTSKFARNQTLFVDSLFHSDGTCSGTFKVKRGRGRVAIELRDMQGVPIALVSPDGCIVTAFNDPSGKTFYMYAMTKETAQFLGLQSATYSEERAIGKAAIESAGQ